MLSLCVLYKESRESLRALFVEDAQDDVDLALLSLERDGFDVEWARVDDASALQLSLARHRPQVILCDYTMPAFNGLDALQIVRKVDADLPFIFLSGTIGEDVAVASVRRGASDYIIKSNLRRLGTAVRRAIADAEERARTRRLEEERAQLATIMEATTDFVAIFDADGRLKLVNSAATSVLGLGDRTISDRTLWSLLPDWAARLTQKEALPKALRTGSWSGESALLDTTGAEIPVSQVIIAHRGPGQELRYLSTIARDIRDRKAYESRIAYLANYDDLTGLPNQNLLADRIDQAIAASSRSEVHGCAVVSLEIDQYRLIHDGFGPEAALELVRVIAQRLSCLVDPGDTVARRGTDHFGILLCGLAGADQAAGIVARIRRAVTSVLQLNSREVFVSVSVGASVHPRDGNDSATLLRHSDAAMQRAAAKGPGAFQFYTPDMTKAAEAHAFLVTELQNAVTRREMMLHYQPQVDLATRRTVGVEALLRWHHKERGWITPAEFIPVAEQIELIHELGEFALTTACMDLKRWEAFRSDLRMAVNVSTRQFRSRTFVDDVARNIRQINVRPELIELELTESMLMDDPDSAAATLRKLKDLGILLALDDFGTGYSSLNYLSRFPLDCLKIDQSFVNRAAFDKHCAVIIESIISLAGALDLRVVAEGIETEHQLDLLISHGCTEGQGFLFSKAVPRQDIGRLLANASC